MLVCANVSKSKFCSGFTPNVKNSLWVSQRRLHGISVEVASALYFGSQSSAVSVLYLENSNNNNRFHLHQQIVFN